MNLFIDDKRDEDFHFVLEKPISLPVSEMRTKFIDVDGRDGSVHEDLGLQDATLSATLNLIRFSDPFQDVSRFTAALFRAQNTDN